MTKNPPYNRPGYSKNEYSSVDYQESQYTQADYSNVSYSEEEYTGDAGIKDELIGKINRKDAVVGVVGLGYVGLALAVEAAQAGFKVVGVDTNLEIVENINKGQSHIEDVSSGLLKELVQKKKLQAHTDYAALKAADCISIAVPTPLRKTKDPDVTYITGALDSLLPFLDKAKLVVLESTTYPGTTEELLANRISQELKLKIGYDFFVAFSPERVDPGNKKWTTKNTPKVVGGITENCSEVARAYYGAIVNTVHMVSSAREAETVKLLENTFRAVNIGLVNEFLLMCSRMEIDIWNVIEAAATKPFGFMSFMPGPGIGGHCIPLDPMYLSWKARTFDFYNRFIELATDINGNMPRFVLSRVADLLNDCEKAIKGSKIIILGVAYKKNVGDLRESPGLELFGLLEKKGAQVCFNDPHAAFFMAGDKKIKRVELLPEVLKNFDAAVLVTDHDAFDYKAIAQEAPLVLDCRNVFAKNKIVAKNIYKL